jgi:hypothetical protein
MTLRKQIVPEHNYVVLASRMRSRPAKNEQTQNEANNSPQEKEDSNHELSEHVVVI